MDTTHFEESVGLKKVKSNKQKKNDHTRHHRKNTNQSKISIIAINKKDEENDDDDENNINLNSISNTTSVEELIIRCQHCGKRNVFHDYARCMNDDKWICILQCPICLKMMSTASVSTQLSLSIRNFIKKYYQGWLYCENEMDCGYKTNDNSIHCNNAIECDGVLKREVKKIIVIIK